MDPLETVAPAFVEIAHRIVWATVATTDPRGRPASRILHPIWEWDGTQLQGWIATAPQSPKARDLAGTPYVSLTYWDPTHDTCTADGAATWLDDLADRQALWDKFSSTPPPLGYDPKIIPGWTAPDVPAFGVLHIVPDGLRVLRGADLMSGGRPLAWRATA
jgi:general stress protein 26